MKDRRKDSGVPTFDRLLLPTLKAMKILGGSGSIEEINGKVYEIAKIDEQTLTIPHKEGRLLSEVDYRMAWARTYLKKFGMIDNSSRGVWALVDNNLNPDAFSRKEIVDAVKAESYQSKVGRCKQDECLETIESGDPDWKENLLNILWEMKPDAFERLCQRLLRESGFIQVEVTGKSCDGGIDGKGILRLNGLLSFHVFFQCKRFRGTVSSGHVRDFRGAMQGRSDKGLFLTTGKFTRDAIREASRDGAPPIDLLDGDMLCDKLKVLQLGVMTETIEQVTVLPEWFGKI